MYIYTVYALLLFLSSQSIFQDMLIVCLHFRFVWQGSQIEWTRWAAQSQAGVLDNIHISGRGSRQHTYIMQGF